MGTVGHNSARDNWFWSDGNLDNEAWDNALSVAATGRITQLTAYMAGDTGTCIGGPALWDAAGNLLLYTAQSIARRSAPYSGGFDGTGRNPNDGYFINVYGFNHTFTNPTSFIVGAFRRSVDSWILGFSDHDTNYGHLKTTGSSTPASATGGNTWSHESGFNGGVQAYATYIPLGIFARVGGSFVPATLKRFFDSVSTYFATVMGDRPWMYWRLDEASGSVLDYGTEGLDLNVAGPTLRSQSAVIIDADTAMHFREGPFYGFFQYDDCGLYRDVTGRAATNSDCGPLTWSVETWFNADTTGPDHTGLGHANDLVKIIRPSAPDGEPFGITVLGGTDLIINVGSLDYGGLGNNCFTQTTVPGVVSTGTVNHVVVTYDAGSGWNGDGNPLGSTGVLKVYVNGVLVHTESGMCSIRQNFFSPAGDTHPPQYLIIGSSQAVGGVSGANQSWSFDGRLDEPAFFDYVLTPTQVAHHYAVGTGATGGIVSTGGTLYVRNDANTAWIQLNMAALDQQMPERKEFPVLEVWPDGRYRRLLGRWGEPERFGMSKGDWQRSQSGLVVPRRAAWAT